MNRSSASKCVDFDAISVIKCIYLTISLGLEAKPLDRPATISRRSVREIEIGGIG